MRRTIVLSGAAALLCLLLADTAEATHHRYRTTYGGYYSSGYNYSGYRGYGYAPVYNYYSPGYAPSYGGAYYGGGYYGGGYSAYPAYGYRAGPSFSIGFSYGRGYYGGPTYGGYGRSGYYGGYGYRYR